VLEGRIDGDDLGVGLGMHQAWKAVASVAADALAQVWIRFVEHDAQRRMKGFQALLSEILAKLLKPRFVTDGGKRVRGAGGRLAGVLSSLAMHLVEPFGLRIVGL
jgi:hypothetical protein